MSALEGVILSLSDRGIGGWIRDADDAQVLTLVLLVNGKERARCVVEPGQGGAIAGRRRFSIELPDGAPSLIEGDRVAIRSLPGGQVLRGTPFGFDAAAIRAAERRGATEPSDEEVEQMRTLVASLPRPGERSSWKVFGSALHAFVLRELRDRFGRSRSAFLWAILQPMLFLVGLSAVRHMLGRGRDDIYGVSGMYFFWLGVVPFFMFMHGFNRSMGASRSYKGLYQFKQVQPFDVLLVRVLFEFLTMVVVFTLLLSGFSWFGQDVSAESWLLFACVLTVMFVFTLGCGLIADICVARNPESRQIISVLERPLFLISGVFFTIDHVPPGVREWLLWNPLLHGIDLARGAMLHKYDAIGSWAYFCGSALVALAVGLALYRRYRRDLIGQ